MGSIFMIFLLFRFLVCIISADDPSNWQSGYHFLFSLGNASGKISLDWTCEMIPEDTCNIHLFWKQHAGYNGVLADDILSLNW